MNLKKNVLTLGLAFVVIPFAHAQQPSKLPTKVKEESKPIKKSLSTAKLVEEVKAQPGKLVIPYKKYKLENGLTVIIHEDHSDPVVYTDVTYHVGSAREQQGRSGFAHFFEHMMFQGSKHVGDEMHFKYISEAGGDLNGTTNLDRTNYFETVPSNNFEMTLWLEADRMGFLLDSVTQPKFEVQRATVKNERGQRYDNAPYGVVPEKIGEALYPQGHPYSWTTIGYIEDLNRVDVNDLKRFYMRWYGPNNATLTIAGDIKTEEALKKVEKYFSGIPVGPEVKAQTVAPVKLDANRYISYEDNVKFPMIKMVWPTVPAYSKDEAALDALGSILYSGKTTPFYINFVKNQKASSVSVYNSSSELAGKFEVTIRGNKDAKLADLEKEVRQLLADWEAKGFSDDELKKFKAETQSDYYNALTSVRGKGARLAAYNTFTGNPNYLDYDLNRYLKLTKADIIAAYNKYIKGQNAVILSCVPKGKSDLIAAPDNWKMYTRTIEKESAEYSGLTPRNTAETFDWSKKPEGKSRPVVKAPAFWEEKMTNGIQVMGSSDSEVPKVNILLSIAAGHRYETAAKSGTAYLMADLLNESTQLHSAEEISDILAKMGSEISVSASSSEININVNCLKANTGATLKILEEILLKPKFDSEEFARVKKELQDQIALQNTQAAPIADKVFNKLVYSEKHILSNPTTGTAATVESITLDDVKNYYAKHIAPSVTKVIIVGDAKKEEILKQLTFLSTWKKDAPVLTAQPALPSTGKTKIYFVDKKGAAQSEIRIGAAGMPYDATGAFYKTTIANYPFCGNFNSRLNTLLREVKGYTYGVKARFAGNEFEGNYLISAGVRSNSTDSSLMFTLEELKKYVDGGVTSQELDFAKSGITNSEALKYETPYQKIFFLKQLMDYKLSPDFTAKQNEILNSMTKEELNQVAKNNLNYNNMIIVVVGDKETNLEKVKKLGYEVQELTTDGEVVR
ncbi:MAG TPA: pitrilysin family protein [Bacteroidia bacterium]